MPNPRAGLWWLQTIWLLGVLVGCGSRSAPEVQVYGRVTCQGQPVAGGLIVFTPDADRGYEGSIATATIQADGSYRLVSHRCVGLAPGWYRVTVAGPVSEEYTAPGSLLPARRYRYPELSGLCREVSAEAEQAIHFDLDTD